jgi:hypothetical protein
MGVLLQCHEVVERIDLRCALNKAVPEMAQAIRSTDPKAGLEHGLERINDQLEGVGAAASHVSGIIETATKIARSTGIIIKTVAPFLAALL